MTEIVSLPDVTQTTLGAALHGGVLSIGNFDGVHRGHATLLGQTKSLATQLGGPTIACLFEPHPISLLRPQLAPQRLTSVTQRGQRMAKLGVDFLVVCQTSRDLLDLGPEAFFQGLVVNNLNCRGVVEGNNFCFGKDRNGDVVLLNQLCEKNQIEFRVAKMESADGKMISSTRIRDLLASGNVRQAAEMMSTPHQITGTVVHGDARGRTIGFPTANLDHIDVVVPAPGVYAGVATIDGTDHVSAINIGQSPTFGSGTPGKVEVHVIDFQGDLYGQTVSVTFIDRVRDIIRFDSADALANQLKQDIQSAQQLLDQHQRDQSS